MFPIPQGQGSKGSVQKNKPPPINRQTRPNHDARSRATAWHPFAVVNCQLVLGRSPAVPPTMPAKQTIGTRPPQAAALIPPKAGQRSDGGDEPLSVFTARIVAGSHGFAAGSRVSLLTLYHYLPCSIKHWLLHLSFIWSFRPLVGSVRPLPGQAGFGRLPLEKGDGFLDAPPVHSFGTQHTTLVDSSSRCSLSILVHAGIIPPVSVWGAYCVRTNRQREKRTGAREKKNDSLETARGDGVHRSSREERRGGIHTRHVSGSPFQEKKIEREEESEKKTCHAATSSWRRYYEWLSS
ncbi:hypothetical protein LZ30DRAFT_240056 [Colletotrichum cereale]|nr:hypothetical protein LZ30DRAFT_240056 [Colletotrichum cereale]